MNGPMTVTMRSAPDDHARLSMAAGDETIRIRIPIKMRKRAGRREVIATQEPPAPHEALVRAVARGHAWQALLDSGEVKSISALAGRFHVDHSYVARTIKLANLSPKIVEMIVEGREPDGLSLRRLWQGLPALWAEQQAELCGDGCVEEAKLNRRR
jgi:hypothetical protein